MSRDEHRESSRARAIRQDALNRLAERERASLPAVLNELAELKSMLAAQQAGLNALTMLVEELAGRLRTDSPIISSPRSLSPAKRQILERIQELRRQQLSFAQILEIFIADRVPTLSGQGQWSKGTLWNLWKNHRHQL